MSQLSERLQAACENLYTVKSLRDIEALRNILSSMNTKDFQRFMYMLDFNLFFTVHVIYMNSF